MKFNAGGKGEWGVRGSGGWGGEGVDTLNGAQLFVPESQPLRQVSSYPK